MVPFLIPTIPPGLAPKVLNYRSYPLHSTKDLLPLGMTVKPALYRGRSAVQATVSGFSAQGCIALLNGSDFRAGTIEFDVAAMPTQSISSEARGFVGIAFHVDQDRRQYECFFMRMTNSRSIDQERRNHSVQYCCPPLFSWARLRHEAPSRYESYADLEPGAWTHVRVVLLGLEARLYVGNSPQPCLVVRNLFLGRSHGPLALWVGEQTNAYFSHLTMKSF